MRAAQIKQVGEDPVVNEVPEPQLGSAQALVEVGAAALNPLDLGIASGALGGEPEVPYIPGFEGVGTVVEGESLSAGTRVRFEIFSGFGQQGTFAEQAVVEEASVLEVPESIDDALAASLGVAGLAAWLALGWRAELREGETVLVLGASGGVGQTAVQIAKIMGASRVIAAARDDAGLNRAQELGADAIVQLGSEESPTELSEKLKEAAGVGIDVTVDPLWGTPAVAAAMASGSLGRLVNLGQAASTEATFPAGALLGNMAAVMGFALLGVPPEVKAEAWGEVMDHAKAGRLTVDHEVLPLEEIAQAWERQAHSPHRKLVISPALAGQNG